MVAQRQANRSRDAIKLVPVQISFLLFIKQLEYVHQAFFVVLASEKVARIRDKLIEGHSLCAGEFIRVGNPAHHGVQGRIRFVVSESLECVSK